jgi:hypothetical protein
MSLFNGDDKVKSKKIVVVKVITIKKLKKSIKQHNMTNKE